VSDVTPSSHSNAKINRRALLSGSIGFIATAGVLLPSRPVCAIEKDYRHGALSVMDFGARPGLSDNTASLDAAVRAAAARGLGLYIPQGRFWVRELRLRNGLRFIEGPGWLVGSDCGPEAVITTNDLGSTTPVRNMRISVRIDCNYIARRGIFGVALQDSEISDCEIVNLSHNGGDAIRLNFPGSSGNVVTRNRVVLATSGAARFPEGLFGIHVVGESVTSKGGLERLGRPSFVTMTTRNNRIIANHVTGGTHGIGFFSAPDFICSDNLLERQILRNIIAGPTCIRGVIERNRCMEAGSSGVHIALGSSMVRIANNLIRSSRVSENEDDDAAIQAYAYCTDIEITNNDIAGDWRYGVYVGYARNVMIFGNSIDATNFRSASIAIESGWQSTLPPQARFSRARAVGYQIDIDTTDIFVKRNIINGGPAAFSLAQIGPRSLTRVRLVSNRVRSAATDVVAVELKPGALADLELIGLDTDAAAPHLELPRGRAHFSRIEGVKIP